MPLNPSEQTLLTWITENKPFSSASTKTYDEPLEGVNVGMVLNEANLSNDALQNITFNKPVTNTSFDGLKLTNITFKDTLSNVDFVRSKLDSPMFHGNLHSVNLSSSQLNQAGFAADIKISNTVFSRTNIVSPSISAAGSGSGSSAAAVAGSDPESPVSSIVTISESHSIAGPMTLTLSAGSPSPFTITDSPKLYTRLKIVKTDSAETPATVDDHYRTTSSLAQAGFRFRSIKSPASESLLDHPALKGLKAEAVAFKVFLDGQPNIGSNSLDAQTQLDSMNGFIKQTSKALLNGSLKDPTPQIHSFLETMNASASVLYLTFKSQQRPALARTQSQDAVANELERIEAGQTKSELAATEELAKIFGNPEEEKPSSTSASEQLETKPSTIPTTPFRARFHDPQEPPTAPENSDGPPL